jgi:hypothetical protein
VLTGTAKRITIFKQKILGTESKAKGKAKAAQEDPDATSFVQEITREIFSSSVMLQRLTTELKSDMGSRIMLRVGGHLQYLYSEPVERPTREAFRYAGMFAGVSAVRSLSVHGKAANPQFLVPHGLFPDMPPPVISRPGIVPDPNTVATVWQDVEDGIAHAAKSLEKALASFPTREAALAPVGRHFVNLALVRRPCFAP